MSVSVDPEPADGVQQHTAFDAAHDTPPEVGAHRRLPIGFEVLRAAGFPTIDNLASQVAEELHEHLRIQLAQALALHGLGRHLICRHTLVEQHLVYSMARSSVEVVGCAGVPPVVLEPPDDLPRISGSSRAGTDAGPDQCCLVQNQSGTGGG
jgi:hypothetical protein